LSAAAGRPVTGAIFFFDWAVTRVIFRRKSLEMARGMENAGVETMDQQTEKRSGWSWWYLLLVVQFVAVMWPPFYNTAEPSWIGIPFYYWYQMLWVIIGAVLTATVYFATEH
jgi:hypothetical protein